jgi:hypothetical protein
MMKGKARNDGGESDRQDAQVSGVSVVPTFKIIGAACNFAGRGRH